jgi:chemotaxis protein MotB
VREDQVTQVRGFADQRLRKKDLPLDPSNRRISMIVQYLVKKSPEDETVGNSGGLRREAGQRRSKASRDQASGGEVFDEVSRGRQSEHISERT